MKLFWIEPNPILLFELRQAVRNRFVNGLLLLYLAIVTALFYFTFRVDASALPPLTPMLPTIVTEFATLQLLRLLLVYYAFTATTLVLFGAVRTASDRLEDSPALSTALSPRQIVSGKMQFGLVFGLLFLSVTFPLMTGAYLMRGLDIRVLLIGAFFYYSLVQVQYFLTVAVFSTASTMGRLIAAMTVTVVAQVLLVYFTFQVVPNLIEDLSNPPDIITLIFAMLMCLLIIVTVMLFIYIFAVAGFSPESSNRMLPIRVSLSVVQVLLITTALIVCVAELAGLKGVSLVSRFVYIPNFLFWMSFPFVFALFICERETLPRRIRKTIPKTITRRFCVFPFCTGAAGAMTWCVLALVCEYLQHLVAYQCRTGEFRNNWSSLNFGFMFFNYCATVLILYNLILKRWIARQWNWTLPLFVAGLLLVFIVFASLISVWLGFYFDPWQFFERFPVLPIPWSDQVPHLVYLQIYVSRIWFLVLVVIGMPWVYRRFKDFQSLRQEEEK